MAGRNGSIVMNARPRRHRRRAKSSAGDTTGKPIAKRTVLIPACAKRKRCRPRRGRKPPPPPVQLPVGAVGRPVDKVDQGGGGGGTSAGGGGVRRRPRREKPTPPTGTPEQPTGWWRVCSRRERTPPTGGGQPPTDAGAGQEPQKPDEPSARPRPTSRKTEDRKT